MTACRDQKDRLLDLALGALSASAVSELEQHLIACPACAAALAELRVQREQMEAGLRQLIRGAEPTAVFRARVLAATETSAVSWLARPAWVGVLAAALVFVLAAVLLPGLGERWPSLTRSRSASLAPLSEWRSPTESLLRSPGDELLWSTPRLGQFYFPLQSALPGAGEIRWRKQ